MSGQDQALLNMSEDQQLPQRRVHRCKTCDRVFVRAEHLRRHALSHENKKPNICKACGSRFGRSDVLRRHMRNCAEHQSMVQGLSTDSGSERSRQKQYSAGWKAPERVDVLGDGTLPHVHHVNSSLRSPRPTLNLTPPETRPSVDSLMIGSGSTAVLPETPSVAITPTNFLGTEDFDDMSFLEDILLPDTTMIPSYITSTAFEDDTTLAASTADDIGLSHHASRPFFSLLQAAEPSHARGKLSEPSYFQVLSTSNYEVEEFRKQLHCICNQDRLKSFRFPSRSRLVRCILAYFDHFDPHTPIIQYAKFSLCESHPALVLAILAIGAMYLSEHEFSFSAYELACSLLESYSVEGQAEGDPPSQYEFAPLQAMLLCIQFSMLRGQEAYSHHIQRQFAMLSETLKDGMSLLRAEKAQPDQNWERWSFIETFSRLATWTCTLSAILLANDPTSTYVAPYELREVPLPLAEELWRARSASQWLATSTVVRVHGETNLSIVAEALLQGSPIPENLSSFALLALVGWALSYICAQERLSMSMGPGGLLDGDFRARMERVLSQWEAYTRRRMRADRAIYRLNDPLFTDCFPLLASSYYHLYLGNELRLLKARAAREEGGRGISGGLPPVRNLALAHKAISYAANSWLVRAKQGIGHFQDTGAINYGAHYHMSSYENALILSWWLTIDRRPELQASSGQYAAVVKPIREILSEAFTEVDDQGIPCTDATSRIVAPLLFIQRSTARSVYPLCRVLGRRIEGFSRYIKQHELREEAGSGPEECRTGM